MCDRRHTQTLVRAATLPAVQRTAPRARAADRRAEQTAQGTWRPGQAGAPSEAGATCVPRLRRRRAAAPQRRREAPNGGGSSVSVARRKLIAAASALGLGLSGATPGDRRSGPPRRQAAVGRGSGIAAPTTPSSPSSTSPAIASTGRSRWLAARSRGPRRRKRATRERRQRLSDARVGRRLQRHARRDRLVRVRWRPHRGLGGRRLPRQVPVRLRHLGVGRRVGRPGRRPGGRAGLSRRAAVCPRRLEPLADLRLT